MNKLTLSLLSAFVLSLTLGGGQTLRAEEPKTTTLASDLENPCGVTTHPRSGAVLVAAHDGVYIFRPRQEYKKSLYITGFSSDNYGKGPIYKIGPLGLTFIDGRHLVVGDGSQVDGKEVVYIFQMERMKQSYTVSEAQSVIGPIGPDPEKTPKGEGNFYGVAAANGNLFFTCNGDDTKGWIAKVKLDGDKPTGKLELAIASKVATNVDAPVAITFSPDQKQLVVSQMGEMNVPNDSLLTMYNPETGKLEKSLKTGLYDISGLAYSPKTGKLYATDFAWMKTSEGGLFELKVNGDAVKAEKIVTLDKPAALAFDKDGNLFISTFGTPKDGKNAGSLVRIEAGL